MKFLKKFGVSLLSLLLLLGASPVFAQEQLQQTVISEQESDTDADEGNDEDTPSNPETPITPPQEANPVKTGSITIQLEETEKKLDRENVEFALYRVADIENGEYKLTESFADSGIDLNTLKTANELQEAAESLTRISSGKTADQIEKTDSEGRAVFSDLAVGVYLLNAVSIAGYELISPTLIAIPTYDDLEGQMQYHVTVEMKHSPLPQIRINKTDSTSGAIIIQKSFAFGIYSDPDCKTLIKKLDGDITSGSVIFPLSYGTVYVKELSAPDGYVLSDEVVTLEFRQDDKAILVNGKEQEPDGDYTITFDYKNAPVKVPSRPGVPGTAAQSGIILWITLLVCVAGAGIWYMFKKKK